MIFFFTRIARITKMGLSLVCTLLLCKIKLNKKMENDYVGHGQNSKSLLFCACLNIIVFGLGFVARPFFFHRKVY
jgi:hypothetical protein